MIGITGHRDIAHKHIETLKTRAREIFDYLIDKYPSTPIVVLSPLADGADRIVAEVALETKYKERITLSVPLPMDEKNYKDTFGKGLKYLNISTEESVAEFDYLLKNIIEQKNEYIPKIIPMLFDEEVYEKANLENKRQIRRKQYSIVGEYIAIHSNVLIAIYDESEEEKQGGTKETVRKKLTGDFEYFQILDEDVTYQEDGIVYSISVPKSDKECTTNYQIKKLFPNGEEKIGLIQKDENQNNFIISFVNNFKDKFLKPCIDSNKKESYNLYTQHHKNIECFNKDVDKYFVDIEEKAKSDIKKLNNCNDKLIHKNIMIRRSAAYLSSLYQTKMKNTEKYILSLIGFTIFFVMIKTNYQNFTYISSLEIVYVVLITLFYIAYQTFKGYKEKTEDYRAISEALRVQTAWNMANINDAAALYYLSHQKDEIGWIRTAVRGINIFYIPKRENEPFDIKQINDYWVAEQISYFEKNLKKYDTNEETIDKKIKKYFGLFIFFTVLFTVLEYTTKISSCTTSIWGLTVVDFFKIVLIAVPATTASYLKSKQLFDGNNDLLKEYKLSLDIFIRAKKLLDDSSKNKQKVYKNLGIEALRENSSWIITRRAKEYNTPS